MHTHECHLMLFTEYAGSGFRIREMMKCIAYTEYISDQNYLLAIVHWKRTSPHLLLVIVEKALNMLTIVLIFTCFGYAQLLPTSTSATESRTTKESLFNGGGDTEIDEPFAETHDIDYTLDYGRRTLDAMETIANNVQKIAEQQQVLKTLVVFCIVYMSLNVKN